MLYMPITLVAYKGIHTPTPFRLLLASLINETGSGTSLQPEVGDSGLGRGLCIGPTRGVLAETAYDAWEEAMILLELLPDKPYVVVPSTAEAGVEAPFEIRCVAFFDNSLFSAPTLGVTA
jgi:hypothetical protein